MNDQQHLLTIYLQDHFAGATLGLSLARRALRSNRGSSLGATLSEIESEIAEDRDELARIMQRLGVEQSRVKQGIGVAAEVAARLKLNGRILRYSPLSRVTELEALVAGVIGKRSLWLSLRTLVGRYPELDGDAIERLIVRATAQFDRLMVEKDRAAAVAFGSLVSGPEAVGISR